MEIDLNLRQVSDRLSRACVRSGRSPDEVTMVAVTKTHDIATIRSAFECGLRHFGENRVQEAATKLPELDDIRKYSVWHMIGHLQTNKVKTAIELFDIIQSVDSVRLAEALSRHARDPLRILLEVNIAGEETKGGFGPNELSRVVSEISRLPRLEIEGLMTIAPWVDDPEEVRPVFRRLKELRDSLGLEQLSMGMTDDFEVAIEEGATIIRVGRALFGERR